MQVYDGLDNTYPLIGKFCGNRTLGVMTGLSNVMYVVFYTDSSISRSGFNASFTQIPCKFHAHVQYVYHDVYKNLEK